MNLAIHCMENVLHGHSNGPFIDDIGYLKNKQPHQTGVPSNLPMYISKENLTFCQGFMLLEFRV